MKHVGLYGGTFDPIHIGHLNLALEIMERRKLDAVWFCPASVSPHKIDATATSADHRLEMVRLAVEGVPGLEVIDLELHRPPPSYTIDTVRHLIQSHPKTTFHLILGSDSVELFPRWREAEELVRLAPPLIGRRTCGARIPSDYPASMREVVKAGWVETSVVEISSSKIRERLHAGEYCNHLLPRAVADYVKTRQLYCSHDEW